MRNVRVMRSALALLATAALPANAAVLTTWNPEERLTATTTDSETGLNHSALAVDGAGNVHLVWCEQDGPRGNYQVYTRRRVAGAWQPAALVVPFRPEGVGSLLGARFPSLVCDRHDTLHVAWHDYRVAGINNCEIFTKQCGATTPWDTSAAAEIRLTTTNHAMTNGDNGYVPTLLADHYGTIHCAWYDFRLDGTHGDIYYKARVHGGWDVTPGDDADANVSLTAGDSQFPALALDATDALHCAWQDDTSGINRILYTRRDPVTTLWAPPTTLGTGAQAAVSVTLAADGIGRVYAAWVDARDGSRRIYTRRREPDGHWTPERPATAAGGNADEPALVVDRWGQAHLAWHDTRISTLNREIFLQSTGAGGEWDSTGASDVRLSNGAGNSTRPSLLADAQGRIFALWKDRRDGNNEIYFRAGLVMAPVSDAGGGSTGGESRPAAPRLSAWPNPSSETVRLEMTIGVPWAGPRDPLAAPLEITIFDATGRLVTRVTASGPAWRWDGRDITGLPVAAGTYFARAHRGGVTARATLTRVR